MLRTGFPAFAGASGVKGSSINALCLARIGRSGLHSRVGYWIVLHIGTTACCVQGSSYNCRCSIVEAGERKEGRKEEVLIEISITFPSSSSYPFFFGSQHVRWGWDHHSKGSPKCYCRIFQHSTFVGVGKRSNYDRGPPLVVSCFGHHGCEYAPCLVKGLPVHYVRTRFGLRYVH